MKTSDRSRTEQVLNKLHKELSTLLLTAEYLAAWKDQVEELSKKINECIHTANDKVREELFEVLDINLKRQH